MESQLSNSSPTCFSTCPAPTCSYWPGSCGGTMLDHVLRAFDLLIKFGELGTAAAST